MKSKCTGGDLDCNEGREILVQLGRVLTLSAIVFTLAGISLGEMEF